MFYKFLSQFAACFLLVCLAFTAHAIDTDQATSDASYARFDFDTLKLHIPALDFPTPDGTQTFEIDMQLVNLPTGEVAFQLTDFSLLENEQIPTGVRAQLNPEDLSATLPGVYVESDTTSSFTARLNYLPDPNQILYTLAELTQQPYFPGIALFNPTGTNSLKLNWLPVTNSVTPEAEIQYEIHLSQTPDFVPNSGTLYTTLTGQTQYEFQNLQAGQTYYVLVIAKNAQGRKSLERGYRSMRTWASQPVLANNVTVNTSEQLGLTPATERGDTKLVFSGNNLTLPEIGSILSGQTNDGTGYLRRVENVTQNNGETVIQASPVPLSDVIIQGELYSNVTLFNIDTAAQSSQLRRITPRRRTANGEYVTEVAWPDGSLAMRQTEYRIEEENLKSYPLLDKPNHYRTEIDVPGQRQGRSSSSVATTTEGSLSLDSELTFKPNLVLEGDWSKDGAEHILLRADGTLTASLKLEYAFKKATRVEKKFTLPVKLSYTIVHPTLMTVQTINFTMDAQLSAEVFSKIAATAEASASAQVQLGLEYTPATGWQPIYEQGVEHGITLSLSIAGGVTAEARLLPKVETVLNGVAKAAVHVEPFIKSEFEYGEKVQYNFTNLQKLPPQFLKLDKSLGLELFASAELDFWIVSLPLLDKMQLGTSLTYQLFSLPSLSLSADKTNITVGETLTLEASASDGAFNRFQADSWQWASTPALTNAFVIGEAQEGLKHTQTAQFTPNQAGQYRIEVSGHGILGELTRQTRIVEVTVMEGSGITNPTDPTEPTTPTDPTPTDPTEPTTPTEPTPTDPTEPTTPTDPTPTDPTEPTTPTEPTPPTPRQARLNDTGITWGGDYPDGNNSTCTGETIGQQDCSHGRDVTHNDDSDGHAGFSFTRIDGGKCVQDNVTGLMWEVKQGGNGTRGDEGLHDADDAYNWYNTNPATNGGSDGYANDDGDICHGYQAGNPASYCNTQAYVARVNAAGWCGYHDWRMPNREELRSIVDYGRTDPAIDTAYFPNTQSDGYWSGSPNAYGSDGAWYVYFGTGDDSSYYRYGYRHVRLVRGGQ